MDQKFYKFSNKLGFSWIFAMVAGVVISILMSFIYGYVRFNASYVYYTLIASIASPVFVCYVYSFCGATRDCRNVFFSYVASTIMAFTCLYCNWVAYFFFLYKNDIPNISYFLMLTNPITIFSTLIEWIYYGGIMINQQKYQGIDYAVIVFVEMIFYIGMFCYGATIKRNDVYCEHCRCWISTEGLDGNVHGDLIEDINKTANTGTIHWKDKLKITDVHPFVFLYTASCLRCNERHFLSADKVYHAYSEKGVEEITANIFRNLLITKKDKEEIQNRLIDLLEEDENKQEQDNEC